MMKEDKKMGFVDQRKEENQDEEGGIRRKSSPSWYDSNRRLPRHNRRLLSRFELVASGLLVLAVQMAAVFWVMRHHVGEEGKGHGPVPFGGMTTPAILRNNDTVAVDLGYTTYLGTRQHNGVNAFLGMRYAAPPLGDLRWRAPVEPRHSGKVERADEFGPICLALNNKNNNDQSQREDCLFVNVWSPTSAERQSKLPVWVFIQGGGYNANTNANWNGSEVVEKSGHNVVLVNFNYRVGLWGFLASERVRADGDLNVGLLDQRMLLKWVQKHISSFGGDPNHIVIHGASAGAGSVAMHLIAYGGRDDGLFVGGMSESIFFPAQPYLSELEYQFDRVIQQTGCDKVESEKQMACLRQKDGSVLQVANRAQPFPGKPGPPSPIFYFTPCIDGDILRDLPYRMFEAGQFIRVPMVFGTATNEGSVFAFNSSTPTDMTTFFGNNYPLLTQIDLESIFSRYPQLPSVPNHQTWFPTTSQAYGDATFICPQTNVLNSLSLHSTYPPSNSSLYAYRFNVHDDQNQAAGLGVPHLFDAGAIFGPDNVVGGNNESYKTYNKGVVEIMMGYYISFARSLDPNKYKLPGAPEWETWNSGATTDEMKRMLFETDNTEMELVSEEEKGRCRFWESLGRDKMEQR
ncbi:Alpha/Beta hydrolase protein [Podospora fimiseda]|uniref:Carboxylic ester hydrolase n=1 Tax=Podospora fimiseda TaxID=252190 RepID=A0AAN7H4F4_9PEZI|nr:Alpha/Beta hydrolase protein [Podospora fimiseda]